jgi:hypothetical protein
MANYGTSALNDLDAYGNLTIAAIGENRAYDLIAAALAAQNRLLTDFVPFAETTTDFRRRYGASDDMTMDFVDEFGRADAQKVLAASDVDIPLLLAQRSLQWTRDAFRRMSGAQMAAQMDALMQGDVRAVILGFKQALFIPTNRTVIDRHATGVSLAVKALVNADSAPIPLGPNGESFNAATHTHYLGTASFVAADLTSLITTVIEHYGNLRPMVYINVAQEAAVRGFTGFTAYVDARIVQPGGATTAIRQPAARHDESEQPRHRPVRRGRGLGQAMDACQLRVLLGRRWPRASAAPRRPRHGRQSGARRRERDVPASRNDLRAAVRLRCLE